MSMSRSYTSIWDPLSLFVTATKFHRDRSVTRIIRGNTHVLLLSRSLLCSNLWTCESLEFVRNWKKRETTSTSGYHRDSKSIARLHSFRASVIVGKNSTFRDDYLVKARGGTRARKNRIAKKRYIFSFIFHISPRNLSVIDTAIEQHEQRLAMFHVRVIGQWQMKGIIASARSVIYRWNLTFLYR